MKQGVSMLSRAVSKIVAGVGLFAVLAVSYATFAKEAIQDLNKANGLEDVLLIRDWKNGDLAVLIRHEERCDRSSNQCLGPTDGITVSGSERARKTGEKIKAQLGLDNVDMLTSPLVRTVQTAQFMLGEARQLSSRHTICGQDIILRLAEHKNSERSLLLMTHSTCINDLIKAAGYRKEGKPDYGSLLFVKFLPGGEVEIVGRVNAK
jgi:phosphohistidine phosphatase SixA